MPGWPCSKPRNPAARGLLRRELRPSLRRVRTHRHRWSRRGQRSSKTKLLRELLSKPKLDAWRKKSFAWYLSPLWRRSRQVVNDKDTEHCRNCIAFIPDVACSGVFAKCRTRHPDHLRTCAECRRLEPGFRRRRNCTVQALGFSASASQNYRPQRRRRVLAGGPHKLRDCGWPNRLVVAEKCARAVPQPHCLHSEGNRGSAARQ